MRRNPYIDLKKLKHMLPNCLGDTYMDSDDILKESDSECAQLRLRFWPGSSSNNYSIAKKLIREFNVKQNSIKIPVRTYLGFNVQRDLFD